MREEWEQKRGEEAERRRGRVVWKSVIERDAENRKEEGVMGRELKWVQDQAEENYVKRDLFQWVRRQAVSFKIWVIFARRRRTLTSKIYFYILNT